MEFNFSKDLFGATTRPHFWGHLGFYFVFRGKIGLADQLATSTTSLTSSELG